MPESGGYHTLPTEEELAAMEAELAAQESIPPPAAQPPLTLDQAVAPLPVAPAGVSETPVPPPAQIGSGQQAASPEQTYQPVYQESVPPPQQAAAAPYVPAPQDNPPGPLNGMRTTYDALSGGSALTNEQSIAMRQPVPAPVRSGPLIANPAREFSDTRRPGTPGTGASLAAPYNPATAHAFDYLQPEGTWDRARRPGGEVLGPASSNQPARRSQEGVAHGNPMGDLGTWLQQNIVNTNPAANRRGALEAEGSLGQLAERSANQVGQAIGERMPGENPEVARGQQHYEQWLAQNPNNWWSERVAGLGSVSDALGSTLVNATSGPAREQRRADLGAGVETSVREGQRAVENIPKPLAVTGPSSAPIPPPPGGFDASLSLAAQGLRDRYSRPQTQTPTPTRTAGASPSADVLRPAVDFLEDVVAPKLPWNQKPGAPAAKPAATSTATGGDPLATLFAEEASGRGIATPTARPAGAVDRVGVEDGITYIMVGEQAVGIKDENGNDIIFPANITPEAARAQIAAVRDRIAEMGVVAPSTTSSPATTTPVTAPASTTTSSSSGGSSGGGNWNNDWSGSSGGGSWDNDWSNDSSSGRSSRRSRDTSDFDDFFSSMSGGRASRELTADDFLEAADGDRTRAAAMAKAANKKRKKGKRTTTRTTGTERTGRFPFNREPTPTRTAILAALNESLTASRRG